MDQILKPEDVAHMDRMGEVAVSPLGDWSAFSVSSFDGEKEEHYIYVTRLDGSKLPMRATCGGSDTDPVFSTDGGTIFFLSSRGGGSRQVWAVPVGGGAEYQVSHLDVDVQEMCGVPYGEDEDPVAQLLCLSAEVFVEDGDEEVGDEDVLARTKRLLSDAGRKEEMAEVVEADDLPEREWNRWHVGGLYRHVFVLSVGRKRESWDVRGMLDSAAREEDEGEVVRAWSRTAREDAAPWGRWTSGNWIDVTAGIRSDCPPRPMGSLSESVSFAPGGETAALCYRREAWKERAMFETAVAVHTYSVPVPELVASATTGEERQVRLDYELPPHHCLTAGTKTVHSCVRFSPDGAWLAWLAMDTPAYESDAMKLRLCPREATHPPLVAESETSTPVFTATDFLDMSLSSFEWAAPGIVVAQTSLEARGRVLLLDLDCTPVTPAPGRPVVATEPDVRAALVDIPHSAMQILACTERWSEDSDSRTLVVPFVGSSLTHPPCLLVTQIDLASMQRDVDIGSLSTIPAHKTTRLTAFGDAVLSERRLATVYSIYVKDGAIVKAPDTHPHRLDLDTCHCFVLVPRTVAEPPSITRQRLSPNDPHSEVSPASSSEPAKVGMALLLHGGPQSVWGDDWHWRWNAQLFAGQTIVVIPNFVGSVGFGQAYTDAIAGDWGGRPARDALGSIAAVAKALPYADKDKVAVCGASYGGYLTNWLAATSPESFKCAISHAGVFDLRSFGFRTDQHYFSDHDLMGPPNETPESHEKFSPLNHVNNWTVPTLFTHGTNDFRCSVDDSIAPFHTLRRRGVPAKILVFKNEGHWIVKRKNFLRWMHAVLDWMERYLN